jgi:DNA-directed RNA polymerase I subunit RPA43
MALDGRVTLSSPDHVSLLVHRTFNVSIPRHHIPADQWEFEYGPAENDPEFGGEDDRMDVDITDVNGDDEHATDQRGRWVHKVTGDRVGGQDRWLRFTVVRYVFHLLFSVKRVFSIL